MSPRAGAPLLAHPRRPHAARACARGHLDAWTASFLAAPRAAPRSVREPVQGGPRPASVEVPA